jgi:hypothetical protein
MRVALRQNERRQAINTKKNKAGDMFQMVQHLHSKYKALNSNTSTTNEKEVCQSKVDMELRVFILR